MEEFGTRRFYPDPTRFIFSIPKLVLFKKLNGTGRGGDEKIPKPVPFTFDFLFLCFIFYFFIFAFLFLLY